MNSRVAQRIVFGVCLFALALIASAQVADPGAQEISTPLRELIEAKTNELKRIQEEREKVEKNLEAVNATQNTLKRDIQNIDYTVQRLNLSTKASAVMIEKIGLEIEALSKETRNIESSIDGKKETLARLIFELYQREKEGFLVTLFKNETLAESMSEVESILALNNDFTISVNELRNLQENLGRKAREAHAKKANREQEQQNLISQKYIIEDQKKEKQSILSATKSKEREYAEQLAELDKQQDEISKTIEEYEHTIRESFDPALLPLKRPGVLGIPIEDPLITQKYGKTEFAKRAYRTQTHNGIDYKAAVGTPILAAEDGVVIAIDNNDRGWRRYQYGKYILIKHNNNLSTLYAHLSRQAVAKGESVSRGQVIGYAGNTGYSTGAHLHFTVYGSASVQMKAIPPAAGLVPIGVTLNPQDYL